MKTLAILAVFISLGIGSSAYLAITPETRTVTIETPYQVPVYEEVSVPYEEPVYKTVSKTTNVQKTETRYKDETRYRTVTRYKSVTYYSGWLQQPYASKIYFSKATNFYCEHGGVIGSSEVYMCTIVGGPDAGIYEALLYNADTETDQVPQKVKEAYTVQVPYEATVSVPETVQEQVIDHYETKYKTENRIKGYETKYRTETGEVTRTKFEWLFSPKITSLDDNNIPKISTPTPTSTPMPALTITPTLEKTYTNSIGMEFVLIPAGEFDMGSPSNDSFSWGSERPVHRVKIANVFYIGKYEVTQKQWREIMGNNPSYFKGDNLPVEKVSWDDVQEFIKKLNEREGTDKYRLPSEAEWEYAARAGTTTRYFFGDEESNIGDYAWYDANSNRQTHEVGQKKPNPWGLYDMHGNVWEWVQDKWHDSYNGAPTDGSAWERDGSHRFYRGGSWNAVAIRIGYRGSGAATIDDNDMGFRLVRNINPSEVLTTSTLAPSPKRLKVVEEEFNGDVVAATMAGLVRTGSGEAFENGYYYVVDRQGDKYVALNGKSDKLAKLILEQRKILKADGTLDYIEKKALSVGETWDIGDGWMLSIQAIDAKASPRQVWLVLTRMVSKKTIK